MNNRMRDYMDNRMYDRNMDSGYDRGYDRAYDRDYGTDEAMDGRNPYGSRGGYVTSRRPRGDRAYEYEGSFRGGDHAMYDNRMYPPMMNDMDYAMDGRRGYYRGRRDYAEGNRLTPEELEHWYKKLMSKVGDSSKEMLSEDKIMKKAKEHGVKMDKFTEDEFIVTVLMMYTDYWETAGRGNLDMYVKLAEDFLCDEDSKLKGGEKLAAYYDNIINV